MTFECPNCHASLSVTIAAPPRPANEPLSTTHPGAVEAVRDFLDGRTGRWTAAVLFAEYDGAREARGWPQLSPKALGRALIALGAQSWRTRTERGWTL